MQMATPIGVCLSLCDPNQMWIMRHTNTGDWVCELVIWVHAMVQICDV